MRGGLPPQNQFSPIRKLHNMIILVNFPGFCLYMYLFSSFLVCFLNFLCYVMLCCYVVLCYVIYLLFSGGEGCNHTRHACASAWSLYCTGIMHEFFTLFITLIIRASNACPNVLLFHPWIIMAWHWQAVFWFWPCFLRKNFIIIMYLLQYYYFNQLLLLTRLMIVTIIHGQRSQSILVQ